MKYLEQANDHFPHHSPLTHSDFGYTNPMFLAPIVDPRLKLPPCLDQNKLGLNSILCALVHAIDTKVDVNEINTMKDGINFFKLHHQNIHFFHIYPDIHSIKASISKGFPVALTISVYESFESDLVTTTGVLCMPSEDEKCIGNHAILICGYSETYKSWIVRNSFGPNWGQNGYFTMPYEYSKFFTSNLWIIVSEQNISKLPIEKCVKMLCDKNNSFSINNDSENKDLNTKKILGLKTK